MNDHSLPYCVIGDPVQHSISPLLHTLIFHRLGQSSGYEAVHVKPQVLSDFVVSNRWRRPGFNVTMPHKQSILPYLDKLDNLVKRIGAVNTVKQVKGRLIGFNTDVAGFKDALRRFGWESGKAVVIGAGGACRAAITALAGSSPEIVVFDVNQPLAQIVESDFRGFDSIHVTTEPYHKKNLEKHITTASLLINATPVGMWPNTGVSPLLRHDWIQPGMTVFDMVPNPIKTRLLKEAKSRKARTIPGLSMLIGQGLAAQEIWQKSRMPKDMYDFLWTKLNRNG